MNTNLTVAFGAADRGRGDPPPPRAAASRGRRRPGDRAARAATPAATSSATAATATASSRSTTAGTPSPAAPRRWIRPSNADYAAGMLESNLHRYGGNVRSALSAYNAGSPHRDRHPDRLGRRQARRATPTRSSATTRAWAATRPRPASAPPSASAAPDPRDSAAAVDALRGSWRARPNAPRRRRSGDGGSTRRADAAAMPLNLPAYRPIPQADGRDRDLAPSSAAGDDTTD